MLSVLVVFVINGIYFKEKECKLNFVVSGI